METEGRGRRSRVEAALVIVLALSLPVGIALGLLRGDQGGSAASAPRARPAMPPSTDSPAPTLPARQQTPGFWPTGVAFWDAQHGVIVGGLSVGLRKCRSCRGEIDGTTDGGRSWKRISLSTNLRPTQVVAGPAGFAWMTAVACPPCSMSLFRTTDGGRHWHRLSGTSVRSISFADAENGWAIRMREPTTEPQLVRTVDGGRTWSDVAVPCPRHLEVTAASFPAPARGWVVCVGQPGAGRQDKAILATTDAGRSWRVRAEAFPILRGATVPSKGLSGGGFPFGTYFSAPEQGWLYGGRMAAFRTVDGGRTWNRTALGTMVGDVQPIAITFPDPEHGFVLLHNGNLRTVHLLSTSDGGAHWTIVGSWPPRQ